ncbi:hypothetical protein SS1G_08542 [Sclerotinia sclerotiorum 1980 UF-70]|uniref:Lipase B n=1 Tax=Sclerotinia sclerotiorum (strain ATCC 18683 / 1980 / Ss-1) TaxID=665079 RepID=A7ET87_SCLS1|nr:hypothetical protein SS1G_08542 [Sclerotinia sclerotiorum 1980 UF-70]EDN92679.1 hypothetical protein SS1G_08542 [Sclerotinia sclerotiorum 1980 UF-70]
MRPHMGIFLAVVTAPITLAAPALVPGPSPKPQNSTDSSSCPTSSGGNRVSHIGSLTSLIPAVLSDVTNVLTAADEVANAIANGTVFGTDVPVLVKKLFSAVQPTATPTSISQAQELAAGVWGVTNPSASPTAPANIIANVLELVLDGFTSSDLQALSSGVNPAANSVNNVNDAVSSNKTFYNTVKGDAPFSVNEETLRAAIYIPPSFTWGKKQPVIMLPGTGGYGYVTYASNIGKLLSATDYADPVYLSIPNAFTSDAQINAEYVAYALQYFYAMTSRKPAIVTWSQGSLDAHWAFKYWPSVRNIVTDHIAISPDYHGTVLAYILCPGFALGNGIACTPSVLQQTYESNFVKRLRSTDGDSAYVSTTSIYSLTDEIVQPQAGTAASGFIKDVRGVGVSNTFLQGACAGLPAGGLYTHAGVLYNPVAYALLTDALKNDGPGLFERRGGRLFVVVLDWFLYIPNLF